MLRFFSSLFLVAVFSTNSFAEWGTLKGRFVLKGKAPAPKKLVITTDKKVCSKHGLINEAFMLGKDNGIANVVIYARGDKSDPSKPVKKIHPSYNDVKTAKITVDNKNCRFTPHIQKLWNTQTLIIGNSDAVAHNTSSSPAGDNIAFNKLIVAGGKLDAKKYFARPEKLPVKIQCSIHPWMVSYIVVRPDPYVAVSDKDGNFVIKNLPVGKYSFQLWQEKIGYLKSISVKGGLKKNKRGLHEFEIKPGDNDLGDIVLDAVSYKKKLQ